jgi:hypothetical protein
LKRVRNDKIPKLSFVLQCNDPHWWCNGHSVRLECGRSWVRAPVRSNPRGQTKDYKIGICCFSANSLHEKLFRSQANRASKPSKSTSPNFILLARKKSLIFQIWGRACLLFFFHCFSIISNTIYPSSHTHCGYISSWAFGKSKYPACTLLSDVITCMF